MTMTMRRVLILVRFVAGIVALCPVTVHAADLPLEPGRAPVDARRYAASRPYAAARPYAVMQWPVYPQPHRFDIYGNPVGSVLIALPDPLVVNNGCPKAIAPTYDDDGNLAGYAPLVACR